MAILKSTRNQEYRAIPQQGELSFDFNKNGGPPAYTQTQKPHDLMPDMDIGTSDTSGSMGPTGSQTYKANATAQMKAGNSGERGLPGEESQPGDNQCGWGPFSPAFCARFRRPHWFLFWLCWAGAVQVGLICFVWFSFMLLSMLIRSYHGGLLTYTHFSFHSR